MSMKRSDDLRPVGLTSILDLLGSLLVIVAIALAVAVYTLPGALAAAGVLVLLLSWLIDRRTRT
ncbi:hypothetical protein FQA45_00270 [Glutamicibacter halophytocola]|uniref:Uncharacterized protein n=1 Tax=Glutamicibacter halophytocola TaxID=1933880 RepID=A0ABX5Y436_9MICC|nr:hypothetical protein [Glutamicibacter halophytocola]QDY64869.1 hypothetical protein FQA45_00270 [Glutamicibacter halophytocola]